MQVAIRMLVPCVILVVFGTTARSQTADNQTLPALSGPAPSQILTDTSLAPSSPAADKPGCCCGSENCRCWKVPLRLSLRADFGDGVGYENGFTYAEAFVPVWQPNACTLFFSDFRIVNFDDDDRWEFNIGTGGRVFSTTLNGVLGYNVFYDVRNNESRSFQQVGVGVEYLKPCFEFRANAYVRAGDDRHLGFISNTPFYQVAMDGLNAEIGAPLPLLGQFSTRGYVGYYRYSASGVDATNGIRGRIEAQLGNSTTVHLMAQNDALFDTTVTGGFAIHFGAPAYSSRPGPATWREVLGQRVVRDPMVLTDIAAP